MQASADVRPAPPAASTDRPAWRATGATVVRLDLAGYEALLPLSYEIVPDGGGGATITYAVGGRVERFTLPGAGPAFRSAFLRLLGEPPA